MGLLKKVKKAAKKAVKSVDKAVKQVEKVADHVVEPVEDAYKIVKPYVKAVDPVLNIADKFAEDFPVFGDVYSEGKNSVMAVKAVYDTAQNLKAVIDSEGKDRSANTAAMSDVFHFLGWI